MDMAKEMQRIFSKLKHMQNQIKQVQLKMEYQSDKRGKSVGVEKPAERTVFGSIRSVQHVEKFKETLMDEGQKISELIKKLNNMKTQIGVWL